MDQDLQPRIFISSVMPPEFKPYRDAVERAAERAGCQVVRAENHPAKMIAPHTACLDMVASCDATAIILGARYGNVTETGYSATEDEYREAVRLRKRVYLFLEKSDAPKEAQQEKFVAAITGYTGDNWRKTFSTPEELEKLVEAAIREDRDLGAAHNGGADSAGSTAQHRIETAVAERPTAIAGVTWMQVVWAPLRDEDVLRPVEFTKTDFQNAIMGIAHTGASPLFTYTAAKKIDARAAKLRIVQEGGDQRRGNIDMVIVDIYPNGLVSIAANVTRLVERGDGLLGVGMYYLDPDDVRARLVQSWGFAARFWGHVDAFRRYNALMYNIALHDIGHSRLGKVPVGRASFTFPAKDAANPLMIFDRPKRIARADLQEPSSEIVETLEMLQMHFAEQERL